MKRPAIAVALVACLAPLLLSCGQSQPDATAGGVTMGEARALDEAAEMLEQRRLPPEAFDPPPPENQPPESQPPPENPAP